ncbi:Uncharacterised protein [Acinetobacter baumannii]|uniref:hypothetical protein n=1 Tax=Acinetobacter baumannii TaxID=470 RepID=UPI000DE62079|nr:hypothetical protein [Acinetobacter baumannii]SSI19539.1 Uncharacterised protein [Acinetobacter baumannii]SSO09999.1 Uncharacterised protein [Acinetobacter baumannii]SSO45492.1 Uncharacterised protein [Acinetobacter baumannii]
MNLLFQSELLNIIVQEIAYVAPRNWEQVLYYTERLDDQDIGIRNKSTAECWIGKEKTPYDNSKSPPLRASMELFEAINNLYKEAHNCGNIWFGLLLTINKNGKYSSKFYYEGTPLLDGNNEELDKRMNDLRS